ncbi:TolC family protein [bacterium]|nr:TolC family protein [bacterium]
MRISKPVLLSKKIAIKICFFYIPYMPLCLALLVAFIHAGCATSSKESREGHAHTYQKGLAELTRKELPEDKEVSLEDCVRIALRNNLQGETAQIQARIKKLERKTAFANFLPSLELKADYTLWDHQPMVKAGEGPTGPTYRGTHDTDILKFVVEAQMPILAPSTWYLYAMHKRGEEIGGLLLEYTRQMVTMQVTALYYQCLALEEKGNSLASSVVSAETLQDQISVYYSEGLVSEWQMKQAEAMVIARRMELNNTARGLRDAKACLLVAMGLSPLAEIRLLTEVPLKPPDGTLEELVLQALLHNPQLHISDRTVEISKDHARIAITNFLPNLMGFASFTHTSDSYVFDPDYWMSGLAGVLSVFNGFASINEYKAAREREREATVQREEACLTMMLQVIKAYLNLENADDALALAEKSLAVAEGRLAEIEAQWEEGMVKPSERLAAIAESEGAGSNVTNARFIRQVSIATLLNVLGRDFEDETYMNLIASLSEAYHQGNQGRREVPVKQEFVSNQSDMDITKEQKHEK